MTQHALSATFVEMLAGRREVSRRTIRAAATVFVAGLTAAAAQISAPLPFTDVPFTLQPMVVLLGGLALGSRLAVASQLLYLGAGIAGLPVFAPSATLPPGALRVLGPTGGYLLSYPLAAWATGLLAERGFDRRYATSALAMFAGLLVVYAGGTMWLAFFARTVAGSAAVGVQAALAGGVYPFLVADALKVCAAAGILPGLWTLLGRPADAYRPHHRRQ